MRRRSTALTAGGSHPGKVLVLFALLLPILLGMVGLVIDSGLLMVAQREAQNAADAAAMAAAMAELAQQGEPRQVATAMVTQENGLSQASLSTFSNPPTAGPHAQDDRFFEVVVTYPITTLFMPALGASRSQSVQARAVAGFEAVATGAGVAVLDPTAAPGLTVAGGATLVVNGRIAVNSPASPAAVVGNGVVEAADFQVVGPTVAGTFQPYPETPGRLELSHPAAPDPLINLPTPAAVSSTASGTATPLGTAWSSRILGSPSVQAGQATGIVAPNYVDAQGKVQLFPGVYLSITVTGGALNFNPGVYILSPSNRPVYALGITGGAVTGAGVMFYNTGGSYVASTGSPDHGDSQLYETGPAGPNAPPATAQFQGDFAGIMLDASGGATISLSGLNGSQDPFSGMLFYQRRANRQVIQIKGGNLALRGTIYALWAPVAISGAGTYPAQFIVGRMKVSGDNTVTLTNPGSSGRANQVFLVE
jgi:Flp pilus assembly protein TadG